MPNSFSSFSDTASKYLGLKESGEKIEVVDRSSFSQFIQAKSSDLENNDLASFLKDMKTFYSWCNNPHATCPTISQQETCAFWDFFQDAIMDTFYRFRSTKDIAWSPIRNGIVFICTALLPVLGAFLIQFGTGSPKELLASTGVIATSIIILVWMILYVVFEWHQLRDYRETWARHSACYGRLRLSLSRFLVSNRSSNDYTAFVEKVFSILEQDYNQFVDNLSSKGKNSSSNSEVK